MLEIGSFIKMQRKKQKMTLGELAEGIVSISYLSKIENLKTEPSPHIIEELCKRLGIQMNRATDDLIEDKCNKWFSMLLNKHDKNEVMEQYKELEELLNTNLNDSILLFELHKIRYYLYLNDYQSAVNQMKSMSKIANTFETRELYFWYKFRGNYYSETEEYTTAIIKYEKAEEFSRKLDLAEEEIADLNYSLSVTYGHLRQILEAIDYAIRALNIYMKKYQFIRCAQCHIVLGISYRRIKMYDKAIENYNLAKHLAGLNNDQALIQLTNQNLGFLYATLDQNSEAIKLYLEIVEDTGANIEDKVIALTELVRVYHTMGEIEKAKEKIETALTLLKKHPKNNAYKYYYYVLHTYHYSINNQTTKFVSLVKNKLIPFLKSRQDYANLATFTTMLAKHYEGLDKYKDATKYYKLANYSYNELSII